MLTQKKVHSSGKKHLLYYNNEKAKDYVRGFKKRKKTAYYSSITTKKQVTFESKYSTEVTTEEQKTVS